MMTHETFYSDLESMLNLDPQTIQGNETLDDLYWDSMTVVMFIAMADQKYSLAIDPSKLAKAKTVADLTALIMPAA